MCQRAPPVELTVALDATLWDEPTTGIGRYGHAVAGALEGRGVRVLRVGARRSGELPRRMRSRTLHTLAELPRVLSRSGASVFHAIGNVDLPLIRAPGVRSCSPCTISFRSPHHGPSPARSTGSSVCGSPAA